MAQGLGFKTFATGDILTAADANGYLQSQTVMVFADSTARSTAIATPYEGMYSYLTGTDATQVYNGSAWVNAALSIGAGFIPIVSGSFSAATTVNVNSCFTSTYDTYLISCYTTGSGGTATLKLRVAGVDSSASYNDAKLATGGATGTTVTGSVQSSATTGFKVSPAQTFGVYNMNILLTNPAIANTTFMSTLPSYGKDSTPSTGLDINSGIHSVSTAYDGFTLTFSSATSGNYRIYGLKSA
jgi:hypothetical protein